MARVHTYQAIYECNEAIHECNSIHSQIIAMHHFQHSKNHPKLQFAALPIYIAMASHCEYGFFILTFHDVHLYNALQLVCSFVIGLELNVYLKRSIYSNKAASTFGLGFGNSIQLYNQLMISLQLQLSMICSYMQLMEQQ